MCCIPNKSGVLDLPCIREGNRSARYIPLSPISTISIWMVIRYFFLPCFTYCLQYLHFRQISHSLSIRTPCLSCTRCFYTRCQLVLPKSLHLPFTRLMMRNTTAKTRVPLSRIQFQFLVADLSLYLKGRRRRQPQKFMSRCMHS